MNPMNKSEVVFFSGFLITALSPYLGLKITGYNNE